MAYTEAQRRHYEENKESYNVRNRARRAERKKWLREYLKDKACVMCGEEDSVCLDFHHLDPNEKDGGVTTLLNQLRSMKRVLKEIEKCIIVCANCHRRIHYEEQQRVR